MRRLSALPAVIVASLLAACGGDDPTDIAQPCTDDTGTVAVSVNTSGGAPVFDWTPACAVALLLVEQGSGDTWLVGTDDQTWNDPAQANLFTPPVTYGVAPSGTVDEYGPDPLAAGVEHEVILWRVPPGSTADCLSVAFGACMMALQTFVP